jgi:dihydrofolate reductase
MYITYIDKVYGADTFFPFIAEDQLKSEEILRQYIDERHEAPFVVKKYTLV